MYIADAKNGVPVGPRVSLIPITDLLYNLTNLAVTLMYNLKNLQAYSYWLYNVPWGLYKALTYVKERYGNPTVILSENGK